MSDVWQAYLVIILLVLDSNFGYFGVAAYLSFCMHVPQCHLALALCT